MFDRANPKTPNHVIIDQNPAATPGTRRTVLPEHNERSVCEAPGVAEGCGGTPDAGLRCYCLTGSSKNRAPRRMRLRQDTELG
jgi:hypothetical protein